VGQHLFEKIIGAFVGLSGVGKWKKRHLSPVIAAFLMRVAVMATHSTVRIKRLERICVL
jgi:hypothetical protein